MDGRCFILTTVIITFSCIAKPEYKSSTKSGGIQVHKGRHGQLLSSQSIHSHLKSIWLSSNSESPFSQRMEQGGWLIEDDGGNISFQEFNNEWVKTPCSVIAPLNWYEEIPENIVGFLHTHPFYKHEDIRPICGQNLAKKYKPGFSQKDYEFLLYLIKSTSNFELYGYVLDGNMITQFDSEGYLSQRNYKRCGY